MWSPTSAWSVSHSLMTSPGSRTLTTWWAGLMPRSGCWGVWRHLGAFWRSLLEIYTKYICWILEFACPAWTGALTLKESQKHERVQRVVMKLIFDSENTPYKSLFAENKLQKLYDRRAHFALKFAKKHFCMANSNHGLHLIILSIKELKLEKKFLELSFFFSDEERARGTH